VPQHQRKEWKLTTYGLTEGEGSAALRHSARRLRLSYGGAAGSVSSSGIRGCSSTYRRGRREAGESGRRRPQMGENRGGGGAAYRRRKRVGEGTKCCPGKALSRRAARGLVGTVGPRRSWAPARWPVGARALRRASGNWWARAGGLGSQASQGRFCPSAACSSGGGGMLRRQQQTGARQRDTRRAGAQDWANGAKRSARTIGEAQWPIGRATGWRCRDAPAGNRAARGGGFE
jgi:hypothetical protein